MHRSLSLRNVFTLALLSLDLRKFYKDGIAITMAVKPSSLDQWTFSIRIPAKTVDVVLSST